MVRVRVRVRLRLRLRVRAGAGAGVRVLLLPAWPASAGTVMPRAGEAGGIQTVQLLVHNKVDTDPNPNP